MTDAQSSAQPDQPAPQREQTPASAKPPRLWPGAVIVAAFWAAFLGLTTLDAPISTTFMSQAAAVLLMTLAFTIWWLASRRIPWADRLLIAAVTIAGGTAAILSTRETLGATSVLFMGLPLLFTVWILCLYASRRMDRRARRIGLALSILVVWAGITLVRVDGVDGKMQPSVHWRWTPSAEELYLAERAGADESSAAALAAEPLALEPGDWPGFRGPDSLGQQVHGEIASNWKDAPPKLVWKRRIGPAWSSTVVVGQRLFTQEQRGNQEATVSLDANTGRELWAHVDEARFWDGQAGAGPRATPTFHEGRLYTFGATGVLNCLDAATGKRIWTRDVVRDTGAPLPMWGFSSSPLIVDDLVVVYAGGPEEQGLVGYQLDTGKRAWGAASGPISYSSAQLVTLSGQRQVLILSDTGLVALDPQSGKRLWAYDANSSGIWRVVQPRTTMGDAQVLVGSEDLGVRLLDIAHESDAWTASEHWTTKSMQPAYNDYVVVDNVAYGFDKGIFCALDLEQGKRLWKAGRYGYGQVLLLTQQKLLVVLSESGEVVLMAANPKKHEELGRFQAISGKTWNHPVVVRGRLYVRNDAEMAAYDVSPAE